MADPAQPAKEKEKLKRPSTPRSPIAGPPTPTAPFPIRLSGPIIKGFGRGSAELGIPTANIDPSTLEAAGQSAIRSGVYYGFCSLPIHLSSGAKPTAPQFPNGKRPSEHELIPTSYPAPIAGSERGGGEGKTTTTTTFYAVLSIGHNPFYANDTRSIEVHIMHAFAPHQFDLYGLEMRLLVLGFIRPEYDYDSLESLVEDIWVDVGVAQGSLEREGYKGFVEDEWLGGVGAKGVD
jgi:riboflavin kinase